VVILCGCGLLAWPALGAQSSRDHAGLCRSRGAWLSGMEIVCLWVISMAGLGGMAWQNGDHAGLYSSERHGPMEWILCRPMQACAGLGVQPGRAEIVCVLIPSLAGLRGTGLQSGYHAGLCKPGGAPQWNRDRGCVDHQLGRP
jgi:hypothetical protein